MIHIADEVWVNADSYCFMVCEERTVKEGKTKGKKTIEPIHYYPDRKRIVEKVLDLALTKAINNDFLGCLHLVEGAREHCEEILNLKLKWEDPKAVKTK